MSKVLIINKAMTKMTFFYNFIFIQQAYAHSSGLNASGCHAGSKPYHCHRFENDMVRNRLRCDLASRSKECKSDTSNSAKYSSTNSFVNSESENTEHQRHHNKPRQTFFFD